MFFLSQDKKELGLPFLPSHRHRVSCVVCMKACLYAFRDSLHAVARLGGGFAKDAQNFFQKNNNKQYFSSLSKTLETFTVNLVCCHFVGISRRDGELEASAMLVSPV